MNVPYTGLIPYGANGSPLSWTINKYPSGPDWNGGGDWRQNDPFNAIVKLTSIRKGRSAVNFNFTDMKTGAVYSMFLSDAEELIQNNTLVNGVISGTWAFTKRGANFGVIFLGHLEGSDEEA